MDKYTDFCRIAVTKNIFYPEGLSRKLNTEELMLLNCGVGEDS